jgi:sugar lactone lactonase YvrE
MHINIFDSNVCLLGEGPLWHPERQQLFWFDILGKKLYTCENNQAKFWQFDEYVSAAGWVDKETLLIASETALFRFDLRTGNSVPLAELEADNPITRSNDGRADPWGGFWIGTMGKNAEANAGAIYRWFQGKLEKLYSDITVSNSICFSPDRVFAYFCDTRERKIMRQALDEGGYPTGPTTVFVDLLSEGLKPDGAVIDAQGCLWNAQWGASRVARYSPNGDFLSSIYFPTGQVSCPAFGGKYMATLFVTTAAVGKDADPNAGQTFATETIFQGQKEHQVIIPQKLR